MIRNFNVRHVWNDGYNIHGGCKDISFLNCNAEDCGDEGFSSHGTCERLQGIQLGGERSIDGLTVVGPAGRILTLFGAKRASVSKSRFETEGSYLLPDMRWGYGYLRAVRNVFGGQQ